MSSHESETDEALDALGEKAEEILEGLSARAEAETDLLESSMDEAAAAMAGLGGVIVASDEALPVLREEVAGPQELLDATIPALKQVVEKVQDAAEYVNHSVDWVAWSDGGQG